MKKSLFVIAGLIAVSFFISCGSKPKTSETETTEPQTEVLEETKSEIPQTEIEKALSEIDSAREAAVKAGADKYFADLFAATDKDYDELKSKIASDKTTDYSEQLANLKDRYTALAKAAAAKQIKDKIDEAGLKSHDAQAYDNGAKALEEFMKLPLDVSGKDALKVAEDALNSYTTLLNKAFTALAGQERNAAREAKNKADSVKAGVAKKEEYKEATDLFKKADSSYVTKDIEGAYNGYKSAKEKFTQLYETVSANRAAAQAAIERAKQKVAEAQTYSLEADEIAPLEGEVAGIEKEETVLLEEDKLANPEEAVIDIDQGETAQQAEQTANEAIK